ncbi:MULTISPECIES: hypothetical protein [Priestia]|uniref:hypothetical protein n=1 Tax=Priestia TaxID=2800373 RepID=UPI001C8E71CF|nr:hypothetical protein [Priestia aryabhattai]MBY0210644.1 hypothetical protein [Priestia aryabhattai]
MPERKSITEDNVATVVERRRGRVKSPFLREKSIRTTPRTSPSLYTKELFKRSDKAVDRLKDSRFGEMR